VGQRGGEIDRVLSGAAADLQHRTAVGEVVAQTPDRLAVASGGCRASIGYCTISIGLWALMSTRLHRQTAAQAVARRLRRGNTEPRIFRCCRWGHAGSAPFHWRFTLRRTASARELHVGPIRGAAAHAMARRHPLRDQVVEVLRDGPASRSTICSPRPTSCRRPPVFSPIRTTATTPTSVVDRRQPAR
jgi:hypothetical protein